MKLLLENFRKYTIKENKKTLFQEKRKKHLQEISSRNAEDILDWFDGDYTKLSFEELFNGGLRIAFPLETEDQKKLAEIVTLLNKADYYPGEHQGGGKLVVKDVKQKMRRLDTGEEYEKDIRVADLKVSKSIVKVIPKGPRAGEEVTQTRYISITKALTRTNVGASDEQRRWWDKKQSKYTLGENWKQIETAFKAVMIGDDLSVKHTVIVSRHPLDVLRMSDIGNINSCHSQGSSHFHCALAEARGHGPVAYLVPTEEYENFLQPESPWGFDADVADMIPEKQNLSDLDSEEIFKDRERGVKGLTAKARVRLRKYYDSVEEQDFAAPEWATYGDSPPGFRESVTKWAWDEQKYMFSDGKGGYELPDQSDLIMFGGLYRDTEDGDVLNAFFSSEGEDVVDQYRGDVEHDDEGEQQSMLDQWEGEIEEVTNQANNTLKNVGFYADVSDDGEGNPYVSAGASFEITVPLTGWKGAIDKGTLTYPAVQNKDGKWVYSMGQSGIPNNQASWSDRGAFARVIAHDETEEDAEYSIEFNADGVELNVTYRFNCYDCSEPDDASNYLSWVSSEYDDGYDKFVESVRLALVDEGYISKSHFDQTTKDLEDVKFENFEFMPDVDKEGLVWLYTKREKVASKRGQFWSADIKLPDIFRVREGRNLFFTNDVMKKIFGSILESDVTKFGRYDLTPEATWRVAEQLVKFEKAAARQLNLDFGDEWKPKIFSPDEIAANTEMAIGYTDEDGNIGVYMKSILKAGDTPADIEATINLITLLDNNLDMVVKAFKNVLEPIVIGKTVIARKEKKDWESGAVIKQYTDKLKASIQPDWKRLALWIEQNWTKFDEMEKTTAMNQYLIPTSKGEDYIHKDELNQPRWWNDFVQRNGADISYQWKGASMKDVMPYTEMPQTTYSKVVQENKIIKVRLIRKAT